MFGEYKHYDQVTRSLRETLVPMEEFTAMVSKLEDVPDHGMFVGWPPRPKDKPPVYVVPYPYTKPAHTIITEHKQFSDDGIQEFGPEDIPAWRQLISERCGPILENRIAEEDVLMLDGNGDVGIFVNALTGSIDPFLYSRVRDVKIVTLPINIQKFLLERNAMKFNGTVKEYKDVHDFFVRYQPHNLSYVNLDYVSYDGDYWRSGDMPIGLTMAKPYTDKHAQAIGDYVLAAYNAKCKVIFVP